MILRQRLELRLQCWGLDEKDTSISAIVSVENVAKGVLWRC